MSSTQNGFTLWELMMALVVAGIVLSLGVPSFMEFQRNGAMTAAANDLLGAVLLARTEAVKRQVPVTLCVTPDSSADPPACEVAGSDGAFVVFVDENGNGDPTDATDGNAEVDADEPVLLRREPPGGAIEVWTDIGYVTFAPNGFPRQALGQADDSATVMLFCDDRGNRPAAGASSSARAVRIAATGRGGVRQEITDVTAAVDELADAGVAADCPGP